MILAINGKSSHLNTQLDSTLKDESLEERYSQKNKSESLPQLWKGNEVSSFVVLPSLKKKKEKSTGTEILDTRLRILRLLQYGNQVRARGSRKRKKSTCKSCMDKHRFIKRLKVETKIIKHFSFILCHHTDKFSVQSRLNFKS